MGNTTHIILRITVILYLLPISSRAFAGTNNFENTDSGTMQQRHGSVQGTIADKTGTPIANISVLLAPVPTEQKTTESTKQTTTDSAGIFTFTNLPLGKYQLTITHLGYQTVTHRFEISAADPDKHTAFHIKHTTSRLEDVLVEGRTSTQEAGEQAIRTVVVDVAKAAEQPVTLAELMNRAPGIRIRQSGGLGNAVDVSINGFQGNSVQYFKDGIPMEYLGGGYNLNNVPVNLLERIEVYKGVVPVSLGGDALGGAVNLVSKSRHSTQLDLSYEIASFNTHIAHLTGYQPIGDRSFVGLDFFYNYADNDYKADVEVVNENSNFVPATVKLFHNGYRQHFTELFGGFRNTRWTDELRFGLAHYHIARESQHPALMTSSYGALMSYNKGLVPSVRYRKELLDGRLALDQFLSYSSINRSRVDTVQGTYDWYGNFTPRNEIGESPRRSLSDIDFSNLLNRTNIRYRLAGNHQLEANFVFNRNRRIGEDPYGLRFHGTDIDVLSKEALYQKTIAGLTWESEWLHGRLTNQTTVKHFHFRTKGINGFMANATDLEEYTSSSNTNWGIGNAIKYEFGNRSFIRASLELTNRLPREDELFGDNDTRAPNFQLDPERSFNINLGYSYTASRFAAEVGTFYRRTRGMILLIPVQPPFAQYQNLDSVRGYGFDADLSYRIGRRWIANGNITWQDNRMVDVSGLHQWIEGTRLRNTPYFFSNAGLTGNFPGLFRSADAFKAYMHWNFIREFYLNHIPRDKEPGGFLGLFGQSGVPVTNRVPDQHLLTVGANYYFDNRPLTLGLEVKNVLNAKLYDYYKIQRPGRSIHLKTSYTIH